MLPQMRQRVMALALAAAATAEAFTVPGGMGMLRRSELRSGARTVQAAAIYEPAVRIGHGFDIHRLGALSCASSALSCASHRAARIMCTVVRCGTTVRARLPALRAALRVTARASPGSPKGGRGPGLRHRRREGSRL
jgi:hypothetical protein